MTYGIRCRNNAGQMTLHEEFLLPEFIGKIVTIDNNVHSNDGGEFGFEMRSYTGPAPSFGGRDVMIFWSLPEGHFWLIAANYAVAAASGGANFGVFAFVDPSTTIIGTPVGYVFALGPTATGADQFGFRVWNGAGDLMADLSKPHLVVHQSPVAPQFVSDTTNTVSLDRTLPTKPAFLMPRATRDTESFDGYLNTSDGLAYMQEWWGAIKHASGTVSLRFAKVEEKYSPASNPSSRAGYSYDQVYGNTSGLVLPIINAALYD